MREYLVNEVYYAVQGEGTRYGIPHVFIRLSKCNLACGFCDTEFESYTKTTAAELVALATGIAAANHAPIPADEVEGQTHKTHPLVAGPCRNVLFCGGEPLLQLDAELVDAFKAADWFLCVETNGTHKAPAGLDWITCSPKVAEHAIKLERANELKYVRATGQGIPHPRIQADHYLVSPMFEADQLDPTTLAWCMALVRANPAWRLTVQHHKVAFGGIR